MTGHLPSFPFRRRRNHNPSTQAILIVFVALFVLFLWLNFVLSQQIESLGREIQVRDEELSVLERQQEALLKDISAKGSQRNMADRAWRLGYRPQTPIYLSVSEPLAQATSDTVERQWQFATPESREEWSAQHSRPLWDVLPRQFETFELGTAP